MKASKDKAYAIMPSALPRVLNKAEGDPIRSTNQIKNMREQCMIGYVQIRNGYYYPVSEVERVFGVKIDVDSLMQNEVREITGLEVVQPTKDISWIDRHGDYITREGLIGALAASEPVDGIEATLDEMDASGLYMVGRRGGHQSDKLYLVEELKERGVKVTKLEIDVFPLKSYYGSICQPPKPKKNQGPVYLAEYISDVINDNGLKISADKVHQAALETAAITDNMVQSDGDYYFFSDQQHTRRARGALQDLIKNKFRKTVKLIGPKKKSDTGPKKK